ncbi:MAG: MFS transporter, partial [Pseudomonadota bacterium]
MSQRPALTFILINVMLDSIGIGLIIPVMPDLIREVDGGSLAEAAVWGGLLMTVFAVMQFLCAPMMGSLSDRFGRRPILLATLLIMSLDYLVMAVAGTLWLLFAGRIVGGVMAATQSTATAFIADISKHHGAPIAQVPQNHPDKPALHHRNRDPEGRQRDADHLR